MHSKPTLLHFRQWRAQHYGKPFHCFLQSLHCGNVFILLLCCLINKKIIAFWLTFTSTTQYLYNSFWETNLEWCCSWIPVHWRFCMTQGKLLSPHPHWELAHLPDGPADWSWPSCPFSARPFSPFPGQVTPAAPESQRGSDTPWTRARIQPLVSWQGSGRTKRRGPIPSDPLIYLALIQGCFSHSRNDKSQTITSKAPYRHTVYSLIISTRLTDSA